MFTHLKIRKFAQNEPKSYLFFGDAFLEYQLDVANKKSIELNAFK